MKYTKYIIVMSEQEGEFWIHPLNNSATIYDTKEAAESALEAIVMADIAYWKFPSNKILVTELVIEVH